MSNLEDRIKNRKERKKNIYKLLIAVILIMIAGICAYFIINNINNKQTQIQPQVEQLPLKVDSMPLDLKIVNKNGEKVLEGTYENNSDETISKLVLEVELKDTGDVIQLESDGPIKPGEKSNKFIGKAPKSGKIGDVEVLKYKISLSRGVYMEYDVNKKQYNWS